MRKALTQSRSAETSEPKDEAHERFAALAKRAIGEDHPNIGCAEELPIRWLGESRGESGFSR